MAVANWTQTQVFNQLNGGSKWSGNTITYSFPTSAGGLFSQGEAAGFRAVNQTQQQWMVLALATWDDLIPQSMATGTPGSTNIEFGYTSTNIGYAHAYYPTTGSAWFNVTEDTLVSTALGEYGFQTFVHEIGHALGLNHMGDYNGNGNWSPSSFQDSVVLSIMSYFGPRYAAPNYSADVMQADWVDANGVTHSPQTPMLNDVMAIQAIYGVSTSTRLDNTVYGFNSSVVGQTRSIYDFTVNLNPILTVYDSGGSDTLNFSGWSAPGRIDLHAGAFSSVNNMTNNIAIAYNTTIENAIGGSGSDVIIGNDAGNRLEGGAGNDELYGSAGDDVLVGGPGNDRIDGGDGTDTAVFEANLLSYTITVNGNTVTLVGANGTDVVVNAERFQFIDVVRTFAELAPGNDTAPPQLQTLSPTDNNTSAATSANLVLTFNESVKAGPGSISIFNADGSLFRSIAAGDTTQVRLNGTSVTIDPAVNLVAGRSYYINIASDAFTDQAGNAWSGISGNTSWNFTTSATDTVAPQVVALAPADDASSVPVGANLVMGFNETVVAGSGNIVIRSGGQVVRTIAANDTSQVSINGSTVTINPAADLAVGSSYSITIDAGALRDSAGNSFAGISSATGWNFSTVTGGTPTDDYPYNVDTTTGVVTVNGAAIGGVIEVPGDADLLKVELVKGLTYTFTLTRTANGLDDPFLALFDPSVNEVAEDDDSGGSGNSRISFTAAVTGTHYLAVFDYEDTGTGGYTIRASTQDTQPPTLSTRTPADDSTQVSVTADLVVNFSEPVLPGSGSILLLNSSGQVLRQVRANDNTLVHINGSTVTIDPGANLPAGTDIIVNIDGTAFHDAAGNNFAGLTNPSVWNFRTANAAGIDDFPLSTSTQGVVVANGPGVAARIDSANDGDLFKTTLTAGVTYRFDMARASGSTIDPFLALYGLEPEVALIASDDDGGGQGNSRMYFTPFETGTYFLAAYDYAEATGGYTISSAIPSDDFLGSTRTSGRVTANGASTTGTINVPSDVDMFAITLTVGQQYTIDLKSAGSAATALEDPYLVLLDANGQAVAYDDDTGIGLNAEVTFSPATTGTYYVAAADFDVGFGQYSVTAFTRNVIEGSNAADSITGTNARDTLYGGPGNDVMGGAAGDDILVGEDGVDYAVFVSDLDFYGVVQVEGGYAITDLFGREGRDLLYGVERVAFNDSYLALDLDGDAGAVALILGAVFGRASVSNRDYVGIGLQLVDSGISYIDLTQLALDARLGAHPSNAAVVNLLYSNLTGFLPSAADRAFYEGLISSGTYTQAGLGLLAADSELNAANIDLVGLTANGLPYV